MGRHAKQHAYRTDMPHIVRVSARGSAALRSVADASTGPVGMSGELMQADGRFDAPKSPIVGDPPVRKTPSRTARTCR
jgi:hypothetical protein